MENLLPWIILAIYFLICLFRIYRYQHLYRVITIIARRNSSKQLANGDKLSVSYPKLCRLLIGLYFTKRHCHSNTANTSFLEVISVLFVVCMCAIVLIMLKSIIVLVGFIKDEQQRHRKSKCSNLESKIYKCHSSL